MIHSLTSKTDGNLEIRKRFSEILFTFIISFPAGKIKKNSENKIRLLLKVL